MTSPLAGARGKYGENAKKPKRHEANQMNDTMFSHKRGHDLRRQTLIVGNACVVVSFPAAHQANDSRTLNEITRILFDSYNPERLSSTPLHFSAQ